MEPTSKPANRRRISWKRRILFLILIGGSVCALLEFGAWLVAPLCGHDLDAMRKEYAVRRQHRLDSAWAAHQGDYPYLPFVFQGWTPEQHVRTLRMTSIKRDKPADVFRIFCLGGSTTFRGYPAKLQDALAGDFATHGLRLQVINAGVMSYTSAESFINLSVRCLDYEPDAIIVYHAVNDAWPAFGQEWKPDYSHWRRRITPYEPLVWDRLPRWLDYSAAYVQFRAWMESRHDERRWREAVMRYLPDFAHDPYHGVEPYERNVRNMVAVAQAWDIPIFLSTQVYNAEWPEPRLIKAIRDVNDITRSFRDGGSGVHVIDAAAQIRGNNGLMQDICHFYLEGEGQAELVRIFARALRSQMRGLLAARARRVGGDTEPRG